MHAFKDMIRIYMRILTKRYVLSCNSHDVHCQPVTSEGVQIRSLRDCSLQSLEAIDETSSTNNHTRRIQRHSDSAMGLRTWFDVVDDVMLQRWHTRHLPTDPAEVLGPDVKGKTFIVTGPTSGIGTTTAETLARAGARVVLACRTVKRGQALIDSWNSTESEPLRCEVEAAEAHPDGCVLRGGGAAEAVVGEPASVELLARVDTLCLDKTGTITTGEISLSSIEAVGDTSDAHAAEVLGALGASDPSPNATLQAIIAHYAAPEGWEVTRNLPFSSARKWAATEFGDRGTFYLGAPDILFDEGDVEEKARAADAAAAGLRVLLVTRADEGWNDHELSPGRTPVCLVLLEDTVRPDAPEIFAFFKEQGVQLKVISGDNPATVAEVARRAGVDGADAWVDAREIPDDQDELADQLETTTVFGRVTPHQKRAMVHALQSRGHTVAMTGDGVNDVLALKDADMGIAMGAGSSSTRAVAQLVLLDNRFATLPRVLSEGRRVINNIERVANLFITKAAYAVLLTALVGIAGSPFPFLPRQLTLIGSFSIGLPGFFLALAPNESLVRPGFLERVLRFSLPAGAIAGAITYGLYEWVRRLDDISLTEARTAATMTLLAIGLTILVLISRPLKPWKVGLAAAMAASYALVMAIPFGRTYFELDLPTATAWYGVAAASVIGSIGVWTASRLFGPEATNRA